MRVAYPIVEKTGREHPFSNGMAGGAWFETALDPAILTLTCIFLSHFHIAGLLLPLKKLLMISLQN